MSGILQLCDSYGSPRATAVRVHMCVSVRARMSPQGGLFKPAIQCNQCLLVYNVLHSIT
ncbi:unnamed protein product [Staurois parvus]|uniref:Uncharacterized protein n=1 Tax=Staurois parvus TaxID=386267 RepID=A0ABN9GFZ3_9NEOB|nr:unnamed protein product [Staurois parvus]